jgi:hypothetical protein
MISDEVISSGENIIISANIKIKAHTKGKSKIEN